MAGFLSDFGLGGAHIHTNVEERIGKHTVLVKQRLAEGAYGLVDLVIDTQTNKEFVLKRCSIQRQETYDIVNKEIKILIMFAGPYVVEYHGSEIVNQSKGREALILLSYCSGGNLFQKLSTRGVGNYLPYKQCLSIFQQVLLSVQRFHENMPPVTHRDLKLENLLFAADGNIRLCDFGSCSIGYTFLRNQTERSEAEEIIAKETTPMYRAPEMIDLYMREELTEKTDIWALGCIFSTICYLKHPFQDVGSLGILNGKVLPFPTDATAIPVHIKEFVMRMLDPDPEARPSITEMLSWLQALIANQPLPVHILSEEAIQRREARIQASIMRDQKNALKKQPKSSVVPERKGGNTVGVATDSVAAKRLAAKRGGDLSAVVTTGATTSFPSPAKPATVNNTHINNNSKVNSNNSNSSQSSSHSSSASTSTNNNNNYNFNTTAPTATGFVNHSSEILFEADFADFGSSSFPSTTSTASTATVPAVTQPAVTLAVPTPTKNNIQKSSPPLIATTAVSVLGPSRQNSFQGTLPIATSSSALSSRSNSFSLPRAPSSNNNTSNTPYKNKINSNHSNNNSFVINNNATNNSNKTTANNNSNQQAQPQHATADLLFDFDKDDSFGLGVSVTQVNTPPASPTATATRNSNSNIFFNDDDDDDIFSPTAATNNNKHNQSGNNLTNNRNNNSHNSSNGNINTSQFLNSPPPTHPSNQTAAHRSDNGSGHDLLNRPNNNTASNQQQSSGKNSGYNSTSNNSTNNSSPSASMRQTPNSNSNNSNSNNSNNNNNTHTTTNIITAQQPSQLSSSSFSFKATENQHFTDPFNLNAATSFPSFSNGSTSSSAPLVSSASLFSGFDNFDTTTTTLKQAPVASVPVITKPVDPFLAIPPLPNSNKPAAATSHQPRPPPQQTQPNSQQQKMPSPPLTTQQQSSPFPPHPSPPQPAPQQQPQPPQSSLAVPVSSVTLPVKPTKPVRPGMTSFTDNKVSSSGSNIGVSGGNDYAQSLNLTTTATATASNNTNTASNNATLTRSSSKSADVSMSMSMSHTATTASSVIKSNINNTRPVSDCFTPQNMAAPYSAVKPQQQQQPFSLQSPQQPSSSLFENNNWSSSSAQAQSLQQFPLDSWSPASPFLHSAAPVTSSGSNGGGSNGVMSPKFQKSLTADAAMGFDTSYLDVFGNIGSNSGHVSNSNSSSGNSGSSKSIRNTNSNNGSSKSLTKSASNTKLSSLPNTTNNNAYSRSNSKQSIITTSTPSPPITTATTTTTSPSARTTADDDGPDLIQLEPLPQPASHTQAAGPVDLLSFDMPPMMMSKSNNNTSFNV